MTIYTRQYDEYGGIQAVLIVSPADTGLLSGTLLDYSRSGKLVSISPGTPVTPLELDKSWTLMCEPQHTTIVWPCPNCGKPMYDSVDHGTIHVNQADQCSASGVSVG